MTRNFFWTYYWIFQILALKLKFYNRYSWILFFIVFIINLAIAFLYLLDDSHKIKSLYYAGWKNAAEYIVESEKKSSSFCQKQVSKIRPKYKFARKFISFYTVVFLSFNVYLAAYYYLHFLLNIDGKILYYPNTSILILAMIVFYCSELFIRRYLQKLILK